MAAGAEVQEAKERLPFPQSANERLELSRLWGGKQQATRLPPGALGEGRRFPHPQAHIKKKQNINFVQESSVNEEEQLDPEAFQVTVGDTVMVFPPPPPPYFADCPLQTITPSMVTSDLPLSENPPPYHSTFIN
ncbi:transmembrane protein 171 isoform X4 [Podarcis muralis]